MYRWLQSIDSVPSTIVIYTSAVMPKYSPLSAERNRKTIKPVQEEGKPVGLGGGDAEAVAAGGELNILVGDSGCCQGVVHHHGIAVVNGGVIKTVHQEHRRHVRRDVQFHRELTPKGRIFPVPT